MDKKTSIQTDEGNGGEKKRISQEQKRLLVEFLELHPELKSGKFTSTFTAKTGKKLWQEITKILNSVPCAALKSADQWKRTWQDMKKHTKSKAAAIKKHRKVTGGGPKTQLELNETQNRVYEIIGETAVHGQEGVPESNAHFDFNDDDANRIQNRRESFESMMVDVDDTEKENEDEDDIDVFIDRQTTNLTLTQPVLGIAPVPAVRTPVSVAIASVSAMTTPVSAIASPLVTRLNDKRKAEETPKQSKEKTPRLFSTKRLENTVEASKKLAEIGETRNKMTSSYYDTKISLMERKVTATEEGLTILREISNNLNIIVNTMLIGNSE